MAVKGGFDLFAVSTEGGGDADIVFELQNIRCCDDW